jgi:hypothetical protein
MGSERPLGSDLNVVLRQDARDATSLTLAYSVENLTDGPIFLFNRLHRGRDEQDRFTIDPNLVYIAFEGDLAELRKAVPDVPDEVDVPSYFIPCATELAAHGSFQETVRLPLPLKPFQQYLPVAETQGRVPAAVELVLGYLPRANADAEQIARVPAVTGTELFVYCSPYDQLLVRSPRLKIT